MAKKPIKINSDTLEVTKKEKLYRHNIEREILACEDSRDSFQKRLDELTEYIKILDG